MNYELDWKKLIDFVGNDKEYEPKLRVPFSLDTTHLRQEFALDIVVGTSHLQIWNKQKR